MSNSIAIWKRLKKIERDTKYIIVLLQNLTNLEDKMSVELDALTAQVQKNTDVEASAVLLIQGIAAQLAAAAQDPAKITALSTQLSSSADALAAAITANTPPAS